MPKISIEKKESIYGLLETFLSKKKNEIILFRFCYDENNLIVKNQISYNLSFESKTTPTKQIFIKISQDLNCERFEDLHKYRVITVYIDDVIIFSKALANKEKIKINVTKNKCKN